MSAHIPYASATSGVKAQAEIKKILRRLGCENIGFMDRDGSHELLLAFKYRGCSFQLPASAKGWATMYLKQNPYHTRRRQSRQEYV